MSEASTEPYVFMLRSLEVRARGHGDFEAANYMRQEADAIEKHGESSTRLIRICAGIHDYLGSDYFYFLEEKFP